MSISGMRRRPLVTRAGAAVIAARRAQPPRVVWQGAFQRAKQAERFASFRVER